MVGPHAARLIFDISPATVITAPCNRFPGVDPNPPVVNVWFVAVELAIARTDC
jgi:hypothetical protein